MAFTTSDPEEYPVLPDVPYVPDLVRPSDAPREIEPFPFEGFRILLDVVRHVRLPRGAAEERVVLRALRAVHRGDVLPQPAGAMLEELKRYISLAREDQVRELLAWVEERARRLRLRRRARRRLVLLFVLLAKTVAPEERFGVLRWLNRAGYWGNSEHLDALLANLRPLVPTPARAELAADYVETTAEILFEDGGLVRPVGETTADRFLAWRWPRQLLHLVAWRSAVRRESDENPVLRAGTLEFELARAGAYSRLRLRGGALVRRVLRDLDYRDLRRPRGRPLLWAILTLLLLTGAIVAGLHAHERAWAWDHANFGLAERVLAAMARSSPVED